MKRSSKTTLILIALLVVTALFYQAINILSQHTPVEDHTYQVIQTLEIADTPEMTSQGLMWREDLCDNCGMLFVFQPEQIVSMWMRNTPTALDMIFINRKGVIVEIHKNTVPFQEFPTYTARKKATYVIEMKAGFADRENLKAGMRFNIGRLIGIADR